MSLPLPAADPATSPKQTQTRGQDVYGWQMMTPEERDAYHRRMREAKAPEEREQIRREHHDQMVARSKERGVTLPAEPRGPGRGRLGMGGPGAGMGPGGVPDRAPRN